MNIEKAIDALKAGKKIRRPNFADGNYLFLKDHIIMSSVSNDKAYFSESHFSANDWKVVNETLWDNRITNCNMSDSRIVFTKECVSEKLWELYTRFSKETCSFYELLTEVFGKEMFDK